MITIVPLTNMELLKIAKKHFHVDSFEERHLDSLDFHEVSIWSMERALKAAYELGQKSTGK